MNSRMSASEPMSVLDTPAYLRGYNDAMRAATRPGGGGPAGPFCPKHPSTPLVELFAGEYGCEICFVGAFHEGGGHDV